VGGGSAGGVGLGEVGQFARFEKEEIEMVSFFLACFLSARGGF
jgi:hypothetical protein